MNRCLFCYQPLENAGDFHPACSKKIFGHPIAPELPFTENQMVELGKEVIRSQITVTGVQPKLSLDIIKGENEKESKRFTIVGL